MGDRALLMTLPDTCAARQLRKHYASSHQDAWPEEHAALISPPLPLQKGDCGSGVCACVCVCVEWCGGVYRRVCALCKLSYVHAACVATRRAASMNVRRALTRMHILSSAIGTSRLSLLSAFTWARASNVKRVNPASAGRCVSRWLCLH